MLTVEGEVGIEAGEDHLETRKVEMLAASLPIKQERSGSDEGPWRPTKIFKPHEFDANFSKNNAFPQAAATSFLLRSGSMVSREDGQTMLCFSSTISKSQEASFPCRVAADETSRNQDFSLFQAHQPPFYAKGSVSARCHEGGYGPFSRFRGPFTPSQWMELEHQALIYKHLVANIPVPSNLIIPLKRSLYPYAFSSLSSGSYISNSFGWGGSFHLGFSGNTDPEPGRCRRTDGKKWRCSRDAVPDQKYCERHINRGRHRSRKPVEGQTGHAVSGSTTSKVAPFASSSSSVMSSSSSSASNSLGAMRHQFTSSQSGDANPSAEHLVTRIQGPEGLSIIPPAINLKSKDAPLLAQKQHVAFEDSPLPVFGLVSSDALLSPSRRGLFVNSRNSDSLLSFNGQETRDQHSLGHLVDKWPKDQSRCASVVWPEELKSDWTQLSMSIPMTSSDFLSSSNSSQEKKLTISPLPLAGQFDPIQMGLSVGSNSDESLQKQARWVPVSWGNSMGGPLGEVLNGTSNKAGGSKNSSSLNLATEGWNSSPQLRSSPTGVLQKSTFISLSNSSAGSSPRGDNNEAAAPKAANFCDDLLGSTLATSLDIPSM